MNKRDINLLCFFGWILASGVVDVFVEMNAPRSMPIADIVNMVAIIVFIWFWCRWDAEVVGGPPPNSGNRILLVLFMPVGLAVYLYKSPRRSVQATAWLLGILAGTFISYLVGFELGLVALRQA